jgi:hypothetical protein
LEESENRLHRSAGDFQITTAGLLIAAPVFPLPGQLIAGWRSIMELGSRCSNVNVKAPPPSSLPLCLDGPRSVHGGCAEWLWEGEIKK